MSYHFNFNERIVMQKAKDVKTNIVKRTVTRVLNKPYKIGDEERDFLVEEIIQEKELANKCEIEIAPHKEQLKEHEKAIAKCVDNLVKGKSETIEAEEILDYEKGEIAVSRKDNGEQIETRKMTAEDYQMQTEDEPVEKEESEEEVASEKTAPE